MAWVRYPDVTRRKVERVDKTDAQGDLDRLLATRAERRDPEQARLRQATFEDLIDEWLAAGCPNVIPTKGSRHVKEKSPEHGVERQAAPRCEHSPGDWAPMGRPHHDRTP